MIACLSQHVVAQSDKTARILYAAPGSPTIDGKIESAWAAAAAAKTDQIVSDSIEIAPEQAPVAQFKCLWDQENLYVLVDVKGFGATAVVIRVNHNTPAGKADRFTSIYR